MDNRTNQLVEASFRGVPFRIRAESQTDGGRKIVLHDYVNSSERFVEDLGEIPPRFRITAFVHGDDFIDRAERLENALKQEGSGKLFLPTFGSFTIYALPYIKDASQQSVGEITFELDFAVGRPAAGPVVLGADIQQVFSLGDSARQAIQTALGNRFTIPSIAENSEVATFDITAALEGVLENYTDILPTDNLSNLKSKITRMISTLPQLIRDPAALAEDFIGGTPLDAGVWQEISLGLTGGLGIENLLLSTVFGGSDFLNLSSVNGDSAENNPIDTGDSTVPLWAETTNQRIERNDNRLSIINAQRVSAMVGAYEVAADTEYNTQTDIVNARSLLEDVHDRLMRDDTIDRDLLQSDDDVRSAVENVRLASLEVLEQKEQAAFFLDMVDLQSPSSSFVQSWNFYAEEFTNDIDLADRAILLRKLNPELPAIALDNDITVFRTS